MAWYTDNPELFKRDIKFVRQHFPDVNILKLNDKIRLRGPFPVFDNSGRTLRTYDLRVVFPHNYPAWVPDVFMRELNVKWIADRHIYKDGRACLCLPFEIPRIFKNGVSFEEFYENLLRYWLIGQAGYDANGEWPFPARSHGKAGVAEGIADLLKIDDMKTAERFRQVICSELPPSPTARCPCGSSKELAECHGGLVEHCRTLIAGYFR